MTLSYGLWSGYEQIISFHKLEMNKLHISCRICDEKLSHKVVHLSDMPLTDDFIEVSRKEKQEYLSDIRIFFCDKCGICQNPDDFDHESYYQDYQYSAGHSEFTRRFMDLFAATLINEFKEINLRPVESVIEIGSGDGQQLLSFKNAGVEVLLGVEPSEYLAGIARRRGVETVVDLFGSDMAARIVASFDICLSSYTFDHIRRPLDYLKAVRSVLKSDGFLALEIHDFEKIVERTEFCLFEHEHTIYLDRETVKKLLEMSGFNVVLINPLPTDVTRGNSLIVIAKKSSDPHTAITGDYARKKINLDDLQLRIMSTIDRVDEWIRNLPNSSNVVGFGAGGRGIMTLSALSENKRINALLDSNYPTDKFLSPKTRIPIVGPSEWSQYKDSYCIVFSFGYYQEILEALLNAGFNEDKVISLLDFYRP
jgi:SAM-dependent methyltransferase